MQSKMVQILLKHKPKLHYIIDITVVYKSIHRLTKEYHIQLPNLGQL